MGLLLSAVVVLLAFFVVPVSAENNYWSASV